MKDDIVPRDKKQSVDGLERDLYDPNIIHDQRTRRKIHSRDINLEHDFKDQDYDNALHAQRKYKLPTSLFKKVFLVIIAFFSLALLIAGISLYEGKKTVSEELIALEILGQPFVDGGEELELQVRVQNFNEQELELPDLVLTYPKDSSENAEKVFLRRSLDNIGSGQRVIETFDFTLFGQEGDIRNIEATLEYRIEGSSSIFIKEGDHDVIIRSTPTQISLEAPLSIVRNQELTLDIDVSSNSNTQINDTVLRVQYPRGFQFIRSNTEPDFNNNTWYISNITNSEKNFQIVGRLAALEGQGQSFGVEYGKQNKFNKNQIETVFNSLVHTIEVKQSFIESTFAVNGRIETQSSIRGGNDIPVVIEYKNTLSEALQNVILTVHLEGDLYDVDTVRLQNGFYDSNTNTIVFDPTTTDDLILLQPGQEGSFSFTLFSKDLVSQSGVLSNPRIDLSLDVEGIELNGKKRKAVSVALSSILANSDITVTPKTLHYEGSFKNAGPLPPRVNFPTTYTVVLQLANSSNILKDAQLTTVLPSYVEWKNSIAPSVERNNVSYDTTTRKLTWELGELRAGLGVGNNLPRELSFQVELTPSASQVGSHVDLTKEVILSGTDAFTGTELSYKKNSVTNQLQNRDVVGASGEITQ